MTLLDRFRSQSRDKHSDPAVRMAFVEEIPLGERATIAAIAREDDDPRVRKAAVAKLMAPADLAAIARDDQDEAVRAQAAAMLRDIALESFEELGEAASLEAVDLTADPRALTHLAKTAVRDTVALRAVDRVTDAHMLGTIARHAVAEMARRRAFDLLQEKADRSELLNVALNGDFKDTAVEAVDLFTDRADLDQIIARGRNKSAVKRARVIVREADELAARTAADAALAAALAAIEAAPAIIEPVSELASPPHGDPFAAVVAADVDDDATTDAKADTDAASPSLSETVPALTDEQRAAADGETAARQTRLAAVADEAAAAAADADFPSARKRLQALRREWRMLGTDLAVDDTVSARFVAADTQMSLREKEAQDADVKARKEALTRVQQLLSRIEPLAGSDDLTLKAVDRALRDLRGLQSSMPSLPAKQDFEEISGRIKGLVDSLMPKAAELREAQDWKRFANVTMQEQLCARMEALKSVEDLEAAAREVRELQQQWRAAADVPRAQADALWRRFKTAHDEVWARCEQFFVAQQEQRAGNLAKKIALCERAESLADSTDWVRTAEEIKKLQAEWKDVGPVSRGREKAIWDRFRGACDRFFTRRHTDLTSRKAGWNENLAKKEALCQRAETLATSTDWDQAAAGIKALQAEWKTIGPVRKTRSEAIWQRFRGACDTFFARYAQRHDTARVERLAARDELCAAMEQLAAADEAAPDLLATVRSLRSRWLTEVSGRNVDADAARPLDQRFTAALNAAVAKFPQPFAGTDLDPEASRKRMDALVVKAEALAKSLSAASPRADEASSPTNRLASMLKEALAANTIGGKADEESRFRAAADELRQLQASWSRIGYVADSLRRPMHDRYQKAIRVIADRTAPKRPVKA